MVRSIELNMPWMAPTSFMSSRLDLGYVLHSTTIQRFPAFHPHYLHGNFFRALITSALNRLVLIQFNGYEIQVVPCLIKLHSWVVQTVLLVVALIIVWPSPVWSIRLGGRLTIWTMAWKSWKVQRTFCPCQRFILDKYRKTQLPA